LSKKRLSGTAFCAGWAFLLPEGEKKWRRNSFFTKIHLPNGRKLCYDSSDECLWRIQHPTHLIQPNSILSRNDSAVGVIPAALFKRTIKNLNILRRVSK